MSDKHHITEKKYRGTKKWFSTITRAKKKKKITNGNSCSR